MRHETLKGIVRPWFRVRCGSFLNHAFPRSFGGIGCRRRRIGKVRMRADLCSNTRACSLQSMIRRKTCGCGSAETEAKPRGRCTAVDSVASKFDGAAVGLPPPPALA
jgi:hypothetical protein